MFADLYLSKKEGPKTWITVPPNPDTRLIVVIPCFMEPAILETLDSLQKCRLPHCHVEVIVLVNHPEASTVEVKAYSENTIDQIQTWLKNNPSEKIAWYPVGPVELPHKWAGVGMARKTGMDEATRRFNLLQKPSAVIVSLDADTVVEENYLVEIESHFENHPRQVGATIAFSHQQEGLNDRELQGIGLYEVYLRYYKNALAFAGYPDAMFTIGSAFAVRSEAYVRRGGMTRRKAGEDFYFLQGLAQVGDVGEINSTRVYPSARQSDRVPFGTGVSMKKWMDGTEDLTRTYSFQAFTDLKKFLDLADSLFGVSESDYNKKINPLPESVKSFLNDDHFFSQLDDLNQNCSSAEIFRKRFFHLFNAFKILKFMNYSHPKFYQKADLKEQVRLLNEYSEER